MGCDISSQGVYPEGYPVHTISYQVQNQSSNLNKPPVKKQVQIENKKNPVQPIKPVQVYPPLVENKPPAPTNPPPKKQVPKESKENIAQPTKPAQVNPPPVQNKPPPPSNPPTKKQDPKETKQNPVNSTPVQVNPPSIQSKPSAPNLPQKTETNTEVTKNEKEKQASFGQTFGQFLKKIEEQIKANKQIYNYYIKIQRLLEIISQFSRGFKNHSQAVEFAGLIIDFLGYCKNNQEYVPVQSKFTNLYHEQLATKWQKIRDPSYVYNKGHLKLLNYIVKTPKSGRKKYGHCFQELNFDFSVEEARKVAAVVKKMCKQDLRAFSYLSNYFYNSCVKLEKKSQKVTDIEKKYDEVLSMLCKENPPAPPIFAEKSELQKHPTFKNASLIPKMELDLVKFKSEAEKETGLDAYIMSRAEESIKQLPAFNRMIKEICEQNGGYHFKSGVKIKSKTQTKALIRIKEKMLSEIYKQANIQQELSSKEKKQDPSKSTNLQSFINQEQQQFQQKMKKLFTKVQKPIPYKVSDLLRGKCVFSSVEKINKCCSDIKEEIKKRQKEGLKLIEIDNRLSKGNSDLVMKILFGTTIAELQLVKDLDTADYEFSHKLYQLQRSKFFTPLTQLSILNQDISTDYFTEVRAIIQQNMNQEANYEENTTFKEAQSNLDSFQKSLEFKMENNKQPCSSQIDFKSMEQERKAFERLLKVQISQKFKNLPEWRRKYKQLLNNGLYLLNLKKHEQAAKELQSALSLFQKQRSSLSTKSQTQLSEAEKQEYDDYQNNILKAGWNYYEMAKYQPALQKYKLIQKNNKRDEKRWCFSAVLGNIGLVYSNIGKYSQSLQYHNKSLQIKQKAKGKGSFDTASNLNNIGNVYMSMGKYQEALQYYTKCLEINQRVKGKGSINTALALSNMGLIYYKMGKYSQALEYNNKSLEIKEKVKGKGNFDTASTLENIGNVYRAMGKYTQALQYNNKSLEVKQRIKGKGDISTASTFASIGNIYKAMNKFSQALQFYKKGLQIRQRVKGKGSLDTALSLESIGSINKEMGKYTQALQFYNKSLEISQKLKGKGNIDTALTFENIGNVQKCMGKYAQAMEFYKKSLQINQKIKGKGDISTASTLDNIGSVYKSMGKYSEALQFYKRCLEIRQKVKGKDNIDMASTLTNIGSVNKEMGKYPQAMEFYKKSLQIKQRVKGKGDISTASTLEYIGNVYKEMGKYPQALQFYNKSLEISQKVKGKGNIDTAATIESIGSVYLKISNFSQALKFYNRSLEINQKVKGKDDISVATTLGNIGNVYKDTNKYTEALQIYKRCLEIKQKVKGKGCIDSAVTLQNIGNVYYKMKKYPQALQFFNKSLEINQKIKGKGCIDSASIFNSIGNVHKENGKNPQALQSYIKSLEIKQKVKGKGNIDTALSFGNIGMVYQSLLNFPKAQQSYKNCLAIYDKHNQKPQFYQTVSNRLKGVQAKIGKK